ncbi:MAG: HAMP domain-containing histidine kinase [Coriobacteriia bacterium]|nr:HAMP domain-containing histidine kinase [Coriobacteriia bacterium]
MHSRSLRTQLALTYAGIALLTAALLGGILLGVLGSYYRHAEDEYLRASSRLIAGNQVTAGSAEDLNRWVQLAALTTQTRVRIYDDSQVLRADSGSPSALDAAGLVDRGEGRSPSERGDHERLPRPLGGGIFGATAGPDRLGSLGRALRYPVEGTNLFVDLSEAPVSGSEAVVLVAQAWALAGALAVALAALAGYLLSSRISHPLVALTEASDRMAEGDLSARAPVTRSDEFGRLADSFNTMAGRVETTVGSLRRFVADAAHEIGTPLTALEADLELAEKAAQTEDERRLVQRALGQARRLEALSQGLLRLSRIEAGESVELTRVDVTAVVRSALDTIASRAEQAELALDVGPIDEPLPVTADEAKLQAVVDSLLDNAVKFTPAGGRISVSAVREGSDALISVADTGVGIPLAEQEMVFSRFHRARNAAAIPGSGLGLAIVSATVERFGGTVRFASSEAGTRFEVRLPL